MPILYAVIARQSTVLAKYAECYGNFQEVTEQVIAKIQMENHKLTYAHGNYLIHYICEDRVIYMCITDKEFDRSRAFMFLADIKRKFLLQFGGTVSTAIAYGMNSEYSPILAAEMKRYSQATDDDPISQVHGQLDELKDIMVKNIDELSARGERLELLVNKTEQLSASGVSFRTTSRTLARTMFWRNIKMYVVISFIVLLLIYIIVSLSCGGLTWSNCVK